MCEANVYLKDGENEVLFMESVDTIEPHENGLKLVDIFGMQKFIQAKIKDMTLLNHRIILEKTIFNNEKPPCNFSVLKPTKGSSEL